MRVLRRIARRVGHRIEVQLHIGARGVGIGAHEAAELIHAERHRPASGEQIAQTRDQPARHGECSSSFSVGRVALKEYTTAR